MIYVGLLPLILFYFSSLVREIKLSLRLGYFCYWLSLLLASTYNLLDLFWQGMHAPNMFLHRYSWLLSL